MNSVREDLKAFIDGELPEARTREIEAALAADPGLVAEVDVLRRLSYEITQVACDLEVQGASETLARLRRPRRNPFLLPAFATLACLVVVAITYPRSPNIVMTDKTVVTKGVNEAASKAVLGDSTGAATPHDSLRSNESERAALSRPITEDKTRTPKPITSAVAKSTPTSERAKVPTSTKAEIEPDIEVIVASLDGARNNILAMGQVKQQELTVQEKRTRPTFANPGSDPTLVAIQVPLSQVKNTLDAIRQMDVSKPPQPQTMNRHQDIGANPSPATAAAPTEAFRNPIGGGQAAGGRGAGDGSVKANPNSTATTATAKRMEKLVTLRIRLKVQAPAASKAPPKNK